MIHLRQSTASQEVPLGHFVDSANGVDAEVGLAIANTDIKVWKAGAATLADKNSGGATHISGGIYYCTLDATDTDTIGPLVLFVAVAGALAVRLECCVLDEAVYDVQFGTTAPSTFAGGAVASVTGNVGGNVTGSVGSVAAGGIASASFAADSVTASALAADAVAEIQSGLATSAALATVDGIVDDILTDTGTTLPATLSAIVGYIDTEVAAVLAAVDTEVAAILADTNELQTDWVNGGRLDLILDARASQTSVDTVDGVVDDILVDTAVIGAAGAGLTAVPWNAAWDAQVESEVTDALNAYDPPTKAELDAAVANVSVDEIQATALADLFNTDSGTTYASAVAGSVVKEVADNAGGSALTEAGIADAVWDEAIAGHLTGGTTGEKLNAAGAAGDPWGTAVPGAYGAGTAGYVVGTNLNATVSSRASQASVDVVDGIVDDILVDTGTTLQAELDGVQADTEDIQARLPAALVSGRIDASVGAMAANTLTASAVAADAVTEIQSGLATAAALATVDGIVDDILTDTAAIGAAGAGLTAIPWNLDWTGDVQGAVQDGLVVHQAATAQDVEFFCANVSVDEIQATALADLFNTNSATTYASAVAGSVVKETADNAGGSSLTEAGIAETVAEYMFSYDTALTYAGADANSAVKQIADNASGGGGASGIAVQKNAALAAFPFFVRATAGQAATGKAVTARRSLDGGAMAACANAAAEVGEGVYKIDLEASDLNGDTVILLFTASGCLPTAVTLVTQSS